ncbi:hypothetical protein CapIbe_024101 [Capra ibex]
MGSHGSNERQAKEKSIPVTAGERPTEAVAGRGGDPFLSEALFLQTRSEGVWSTGHHPLLDLRENLGTVMHLRG